MPAPLPKTPTPTPADLARQIRRNALPRAAETLVQLLDHQSGAIRLQAAVELQNREEGKPVQAVRFEEQDEQIRADRTGLSALFAHLRATQPELIGRTMQWLVDVLSEGRPAPPPAGLLPPPPGPALDFYSRALAASAVTVEALPPGPCPACGGRCMGGQWCNGGTP